MKTKEISIQTKAEISRKPYLCITDICKLLGKPRSSIYEPLMEFVDEGKIREIRVGSRYHFNTTDIIKVFGMEESVAEYRKLSPIESPNINQSSTNEENLDYTTKLELKIESLENEIRELKKVVSPEELRKTIARCLMGGIQG